VAVQEGSPLDRMAPLVPRFILRLLRKLRATHSTYLEDTHRIDDVWGEHGDEISISCLERIHGETFSETGYGPNLTKTKS
jgi:hypothetical protein